MTTINGASGHTASRRVVKVSRADVIAAQTRVQADRILGRTTPAVITRIAGASQPGPTPRPAG